MHRPHFRFVGSNPACESSSCFSPRWCSARGCPLPAVVTTVDYVVYRFRVDRLWRRGVASRDYPLEDIEIQTGTDNCGFVFHVGKKYVVYAEHSPTLGGPLVTGLCQRARAIAKAHEDLAYLREAAYGLRKTRVFGRLVSWLDSATPPSLDGIEIQLRTGRWSRTVRASANGSFEFLDVPVSWFEIIGKVPPTYTTARTVAHIAAPSACTEVYLTTEWDSEVSGTVVGFDGKPRAHVELYMRRDGSEFFQRTMSGPDGRVTFKGLGPGTFAIGQELYLWTPLRKPLPVVARSNVVLGEGQRLELGSLMLPPR